MQNPQRTLFGIQYLRAAAMLAVLLFHSFQGVAVWLGCLSLGVDLFFVISGFIMVAIASIDASPGLFLKNRILRIVPLYWFLTLVALTLLWGRMSRSSPVPFLYLFHTPGQLPWRELLTSLLFIPAVNKAAGYPFPILAAGWTLNLEMFFYSLFALTLLLPRRHQMTGLSVIFAVLIVLGFALSLRAVPWSVWTSPMIFEFLAGAWIGRAWQRGAPLAPVTIILACVGAALCWLTFALNPDMPFHLKTPHTGLRVFTIPIFVTLLSIVLHFERRGTGIRSCRLPRLLGDASYSIYLWQFFPVIIFLRYLSNGSLSYAFAVIVAGIAGGLLTYWWLERPLHRLLRLLLAHILSLRQSSTGVRYATG